VLPLYLPIEKSSFEKGFGTIAGLERVIDLIMLFACGS